MWKLHFALFPGQFMEWSIFTANPKSFETKNNPTKAQVMYHSNYANIFIFYFLCEKEKSASGNFTVV